MLRTLTLSVLLLATTLQAQVTVDIGQLSATGVSLDVYTMTSQGTANTPTDGINQTWDLTSLVLQPLGTLEFTAASNTPYAASYPAANWSWAQTPTGQSTEYVYLNISSTGIEALATHVPNNVNDYTDPKQVLQFPMTYGQSFTDAYVDIDGPASVTWSYTGHGTALLPTGTVTDAVKLVSSEGDVTLWNTAPLFPMTISDGTNLMIYALSNVGIGELGSAAVQVYPNPCADQLYVNATATAQWRITDLQGRAVQAGRFSGNSLQRIEVSGLATGPYVLVLDEQGTRRTVRFHKV